MKISDHFSLWELTKSQTAERLDIKNQPNDEAMSNLKDICQSILEPVRSHYGVPFSPSSAYRSEKLNAAVGGSKNSFHCLGLAVDIEVPGIRNPDLARWIQSNIVYDQLILECWTGAEGSGWVHVGSSTYPRGQVMTFTAGKGYMNGLPS